jgi:DNA-binding MarR family transcriptional regulator
MTREEVQAEELSALSKKQYMQLIYDLVEEFRKIDPEMHLNTLSTYLIVAAQGEGRTKKEISDRLGVSQAATSRNVKLMTKEKTRFGKAGYDFLSQEPDPMDPRRHLISLSQRGKMITNVFSQIPKKFCENINTARV